MPFVIAVTVALWLRARLRSRGDEIPCTEGDVSPTWAFLWVGALAGGVIANIIVALAIDEAALVRPSLLALVWYAAMAVDWLLVSRLVETFDTDRRAVAWLRLLPPDRLLLRTPGGSATLELEPGSVGLRRVRWRSAGTKNQRFCIGYRVHHGDRTIEIVVPRFDRTSVSAMVKDSERLEAPSGLLVRDRARDIHALLAPFCAP